MWRSDHGSSRIRARGDGVRRVSCRVCAAVWGTEAQVRSEQYLRGLLVQQTDRRNAENLAEIIAAEQRNCP